MHFSKKVGEKTKKIAENTEFAYLQHHKIYVILICINIYIFGGVGVKKSEKEFLAVLRSFFSKKDEPFEPFENYDESVLLAKKQNLLPLFLNALSKRAPLPPELENERLSAFGQYTAQRVKTAEFLSLCQKIESEKIRFLCVKGVTLRALYEDGELRPSSDEDILIERKNIPLFKRIMEENSFSVKCEGENEVSFFDEKTSLLVEAHTSLFSEDGELGEALSSLFEDPFASAKTVKIGSVDILTLDGQGGLLYLVCHAFKHFIRSGFGVRQVCDVGIYIRENKEKINFERLRNDLSKIKADRFFDAVVNIAVDYLGFEDIVFSSLDRSVDPEALLEDLLRGGVYGRGEPSRKHSASLTLSAARGKTRGRALFSALFPKRRVLEAAYPKFKKFPFLYLYFAFVRIVKYFVSLRKRKESEGTALESLKIAEKRLLLFEEYGLGEQRKKKKKGRKA